MWSTAPTVLLLALLAAVLVDLSLTHPGHSHGRGRRHAGHSHGRGRRHAGHSHGRRGRRQEPPAPSRPSPLFDQPLLGKAGTLREVEHMVNKIGGDLNKKIDSIHDEDHGVRVCNQRAGPESHGVCTITGSKCRALNGRPVGKCRSEWFNPFSTCCMFEKTCSEASDETVAYFKSDPALMEAHTRCRLRILPRTGVCQIRIDFLDFMFPVADPQTGRCSESARLRITKSSGDPIRPTTDTIDLCGKNSGQHLYLDVSEAGALAELDVVSEDRSLPISWHLRVTQVDCRSRVGFAMHALKAPPGCLQYHNLERPRGKVASLNFDLESPIAPGQSYAVCFSSHRSICGVRFKQHHFSLGDSSFVHVYDPRDEEGSELDTDRFGGDSFETMVATHKPFVMRVKTGPEADPEAKGFLLEYEYLRC